MRLDSRIPRLGIPQLRTEEPDIFYQLEPNMVFFNGPGIFQRIWIHRFKKLGLDPDPLKIQPYI